MTGAAETRHEPRSVLRQAWNFAWDTKNQRNSRRGWVVAIAIATVIWSLPKPSGSQALQSTIQFGLFTLLTAGMRAFAANAAGSTRFVSIATFLVAATAYGALYSVFFATWMLTGVPSPNSPIEQVVGYVLPGADPIAVGLGLLFLLLVLIVIIGIRDRKTPLSTGRMVVSLSALLVLGVIWLVAVLNHHPYPPYPGAP
jgi:hypothetical protein